MSRCSIEQGTCEYVALSSESQMALSTVLYRAQNKPVVSMLRARHYSRQFEIECLSSSDVV